MIRIQTYFSVIVMGVTLGIILCNPISARSADKVRMDIIRLKGTYIQIGHAWGKAIKNDLRSSIDNELNGIARYISKEKKDLIAMSNKLIPMARAYDPQFMEVLEGMAEGSGISFEEIFALRSLLELMFYCHKLPNMCTAFAAAGDATKDGTTIIGQNIDWHPDTNMSLLRISWPGGAEQLSLCLGGIWEYPLTRHPDEVPFGLASTLTVSLTPGQDLKKVPLSIVMNRAARQKRLERALSVFVNGEQNMGGFVLASAEDEIIGIELANNNYEVLYPEREMMMRANHYLTDRFKPLDIFAKYWPDSYLRYNRLKVLMQKDWGRITPELMMKKLSDHNNSPKSLCTHVDPEAMFAPSQTLASVIMVPEKGLVYIANGNPCTTPFLEYRLE